MHLVAAPCKIQIEWSLFHPGCRYYAVPKQGWKPAVNPETMLVTGLMITSHNTLPFEVLTLILLTIFCSATCLLITSSTLCPLNPTYFPSILLISRACLQFLSTPVSESIQPVQNNPLRVHPHHDSSHCLTLSQMECSFVIVCLVSDLLGSIHYSMNKQMSDWFPKIHHFAIFSALNYFVNERSIRMINSFIGLH